MTYLSTSVTIANHLSRLEEEKAATQISTAAYTLEIQLNAMSSKLRDWAFWNETYNYLGGTNPGYPDENLLDETLENLEIDCTLLYSLDGGLTHVKIHGDRAPLVEASIREFVGKIAKNRELTSLGNDPVNIWGFTPSQGKTIMYSFQPVLTGRGLGPSKGTLIFLKIIDEEAESGIGSHLGVNLKTGSGGLESAAAGSRMKTTADTFYASQRLPGTRYFQDTYLTISYPRTSFQEAVNSVNLFLMAFTTVSAASFLFIVSIINRTIINRLSKLGVQVHDVNPKDELMKRIQLSGNDELNSLTSDVNGLIDAIEDYKVQLQEQERLAAIGQTSTMIGHDLRNPLQTIFSTIFLLKRRLGSPAWQDVDKRQKEHVAQLMEVLEDQAEYMNKIVSDVQDYAKNISVNLGEVELDAFLDSIAGVLHMPKSIRVKNETKNLKLMADKEMLRRIITNLTINAVQAMPDGGTLTYKACHSDGTVEITVADTGVGIPEASLANIFKPFYTTKSKGTGLGLAVCRRLVEAQGGHIRVESRPGEGSRFTISIPQ